MDMDHRDAQRRVRMLNIGYGITLIGYIPSEINYTTTKWETDERIDVVEKNTFPDQFMLTADIVHIHETESVTNPLDCTLFSEAENITVTVELPFVDDPNHKHLKYKAGVRFGKCWEFFDLKVLVKSKGVFRTDKIESLCVFLQAITEKKIVSAEESQYVNYIDKQIRVNFPQNSVAKGEQMNFKVYPVNENSMNKTTAVKEHGVTQISECLFGSHLDFQVPVLVQLPLKLIGKRREHDEDIEYVVFKVNDDWSVQFIDTKPEIKDGIASFTVSSFSGVGCVAAARTQQDLNVNMHRVIQTAYMLKMTCKILFFVRKQTSLTSMMIMLECVEFEKVEEICKTRKERYDFDIVKEWTSKDMLMIPDRTVIKVDVRRRFSMPRGATIKSPSIFFNPYAKENFTRFQVDLSQRVGGSLYGILSFRDTKGVIDEIFYDPLTHGKIAHNRNRRNDRGDNKLQN